MQRTAEPIPIAGYLPVEYQSNRMKLLLSVFTISLIAFCAGCSSFHNEWNAANKAPIPSNSIEGPWSGDWRSEVNGHHGSLRCVVTKTSDTTYRAHFRAHFLKIFRFTYAATLNGRETNGLVALQGEANLGKFAGGVYKYDAKATPTEFHSTYASKDDHGSYQMTRPTR